jgi:hypothetical protein
MSEVSLYCIATTQYLPENFMSTATITQAQSKGLRHQFRDTARKVRAFAIELYAAHGGWFVHDAAQPASVAARASRKVRSQLLSLATQAESHSPALSAELRNLASN